MRSGFSIVGNIEGPAQEAEYPEPDLRCCQRDCCSYS
jgi:hypothetical protein